MFKRHAAGFIRLVGVGKVLLLIKNSTAKRSISCADCFCGVSLNDEIRQVYAVLANLLKKSRRRQSLRHNIYGLVFSRFLNFDG